MYSLELLGHRASGSESQTGHVLVFSSSGPNEKSYMSD
jgi:hypothetical protein